MRFFKCFFFFFVFLIIFLFLVGASLVTARTLLRERRTLLRCVLFRIVSEFITRGVDATLFFSTSRFISIGFTDNEFTLMGSRNHATIGPRILTFSAFDRAEPPSTCEKGTKKKKQ